MPDAGLFPGLSAAMTVFPAGVRNASEVQDFHDDQYTNDRSA